MKKQNNKNPPNQPTKQNSSTCHLSSKGQTLWDPVSHPCITLWQLIPQFTSGLRLQHQIQTHSRPRGFVSASGLCKESPAYLWVNRQDHNVLAAPQPQSTLTGWRYSDADLTCDTLVIHVPILLLQAEETSWTFGSCPSSLSSTLSPKHCSHQTAMQRHRLWAENTLGRD